MGDDLFFSFKCTAFNSGWCFYTALQNCIAINISRLGMIIFLGVFRGGCCLSLVPLDYEYSIYVCHNSIVYGDRRGACSVRCDAGHPKGTHC